MSTYREIKAKHQKTYDDLITKHQIFFAFSESQLAEGMAKLNITDKNLLTALPLGMLALKTEVKPFMDAIEQANIEQKRELKEAKEAKEEAILYELNNHESFYRGNMDDVFDIFEGIYTKDEIKSVYKKYYNQEKKFIDKSND